MPIGTWFQNWLSPTVVNVPSDLNLNLKIELTIRHVVVKPPRPGPLTVTLTKEDEMDILHYDVALPPAGVDVDARELRVTIFGRPDALSALPASAVAAQIAVPQDAQVSLSLVDIDDAGNRSSPSVLNFQAIDTLPPAAPGSISVTLTSEEEVADTPTPEPTPEPTTPTETPPAE